ncbi:MAG: radical SAM-associated putative lipoprotein [Paludibacter sp.]|jgi:putative lipoprotein (rSAM/lipoprotein system)
MKKLFFKFFDKALIGLLAATGLLSGCETVVEYGTPTADYEMKGTITDSVKSVAIQNIKVIVTLTKSYEMSDTTISRIDTLGSTLTDISGKYDIQFQEFPMDDNTFRIEATDEDGDANGGDFKTGTKDVPFKLSDLEGKKSGWYDGKAVKTIDIMLQPKTK